jgi:hypothetical protein
VGIELTSVELANTPERVSGREAEEGAEEAETPKELVPSA